jgi:tellurite resistance protein TerC
MKQLAELTYRQARRIVIFILGSSLLLVGIAMLVLPGPAMLLIPLGLGILAVEFAWARVWLKRLKHSAQQLQRKAGFATPSDSKSPSER